jgi:hypothetical protein
MAFHLAENTQLHEREPCKKDQNEGADDDGRFSAYLIQNNNYSLINLKIIKLHISIPNNRPMSKKKPSQLLLSKGRAWINNDELVRGHQ